MPIQDVSDTALWVAVHRARESARPDALFSDPLAAVLAGERGRAMPYGAILSWIMAVRTVAIERLLRSALVQDVDCVINAGAGLDTRPYRMELPASLRWIELDYPHLGEYKNQKLANEKPRCRLERIGIDLADRAARQRLFASLECRSAVVITEGVVVYLCGEEERERIVAIEEGERLGRPFPIPFPGNVLFRFAPKRAREAFRQSRGSALFE